MRFELTMTATAEVRDKDGNLKDSTPVTLTGRVTEAQARELMKENDNG